MSNAPGEEISRLRARRLSGNAKPFCTTPQRQCAAGGKAHQQHARQADIGNQASRLIIGRYRQLRHSSAYAQALMAQPEPPCAELLRDPGPHAGQTAVNHLHEGGGQHEHPTANQHGWLPGAQRTPRQHGSDVAGAIRKIEVGADAGCAANYRGQRSPAGGHGSCPDRRGGVRDRHQPGPAAGTAAPPPGTSAASIKGGAVAFPGRSPWRDKEVPVCDRLAWRTGPGAGKP